MDGKIKNFFKGSDRYVKARKFAKNKNGKIKPIYEIGSMGGKNFIGYQVVYNQNLSKTPAPKKERIYGSKVNKPKSSESKSKASSIILSPNVIKSINTILKEHNSDYPNKKIPLSTAKAVVRRGMGAYSSTHRPTIKGGKPNSRVAWGLARLNAFVYKIQKGHSKSGKYNQDNDLIQELGYKHDEYKNGGETSGASSFDKTLSASSRFKPNETIVFNPPLVGINGAKLTSYTWAYEMTLQPNWEGEMVGKRVSDWTQADISAETGRGIVHIYTVENTDGSIKTVSSESVPVLLGYVDKSQAKVFGNLATASKTLAKQQMKLAILEAKQKEYQDAINSIIDKGFPKPHVEKGDGFKPYKLFVGDGSCYINNDGTYDDERLECAKDNYIKNRLSDMGIDFYKDNKNYAISDLKPRIERQKRKVEQMLKTDNFKDGGNVKNNESINNLYKDHHDVWAESEKIIKDVCKENCSKYSKKIYHLYELELKPHFEEEESDFFPKVINEKNRKAIEGLIKEHKTIADLCKKIRLHERTSDIKVFCKLIINHIKKEEEIMNEITPDPYKKEENKDFKYYLVLKNKKPVFKVRFSKYNKDTEKDMSAMLDKLHDMDYMLKLISEKEYNEFDYKNVNKEDVAEFTRNWTFYKEGGIITDEQEKTYQKWKKLVNMTPSELKKFLDSEEGKIAGLTEKEADELGIDYGRESAKWILKMKAIPYKEWTPNMWRWAKKQIWFISRMSGNKGKLYDEKGKRTRKYLSLLVWGNNPLKK